MSWRERTAYPPRHRAKCPLPHSTPLGSPVRPKGAPTGRRESDIQPAPMGKGHSDTDPKGHGWQSSARLLCCALWPLHGIISESDEDRVDRSPGPRDLGQQ